MNMELLFDLNDICWMFCHLSLISLTFLNCMTTSLDFRIRLIQIVNAKVANEMLMIKFEFEIFTMAFYILRCFCCSIQDDLSCSYSKRRMVDVATMVVLQQNLW